MLRSLHLLAVHVLSVQSHSNLVIPTPRNAMDGVLDDFRGGKSPVTACGCANGQECDLGVRKEGGSGQPCLWWSQGCSIGCKYCATDPRHESNNGTIPTTEITGGWPHADKAGFRTAYCDEPGTPVLPRPYWTMNTHAIEGAVNDSYRYNPWRAPGTAPVVDPCGQAGGKYKQTPMGGDSVFFTTNFSKMGDLGSKVLPPTPGPLPKWRLGSDVQVAWGMRFNHGGGYQYRLCPADAELTEECFQRTPLDFVRDAHAIMWKNGSLRHIKGMFVDDSVCPVKPKGSTWARNPVPRINTDNLGLAFLGKCTEGPPRRELWSGAKEDCQQFPTPCPDIDVDWFDCDEHPGEGGCDKSGNSDHWGLCSGDWTLGMVADRLVIPKDLKPGKYVVSWRMDCEETAQIWQNCADVEVVAP
mmetsp:Transcript_65346/g.108536  ORF Transcript_65346/g.108536 Transcript_65346/m.108536 type:complete len:413 (-) Transcript_65346:395-1633(-)